MKILLTGGLGYIGSHTAVELLNSNYDVVIIDNLSNSKKNVLEKIKLITKKDVTFYEVDYRNKEKLDEVFTKEKIDAVINFAGFKAVGESSKKPLMYYDNNVIGAICLLEVMEKHNVKKFIFSSTATVYGIPDTVPITEDFKIGDTQNPYATTKYFIERILNDVYAADNEWDIVILRYFNPIGAHESGMIGEEPNGIPNNLLPYITKVAAKKLDILSVFGDDYKTHDGTGVRDYIHVVDVAKGHVKALEKLQKENSGCFTYNLGTGIGYSVLDIINTFKRVNNVDLPYKIVGRRPGDIDLYYSDPTKAKNEIGFVVTKNLEDMCRDSWNYQKNNI